MKTRLLIFGIIVGLIVTSFVIYNSVPMDDASRDFDMYKDGKKIVDEPLSINFSPLYFEDIDLSFDWCTENNGFWNEDESTCYFENEKDLEKGMVAVNDMMRKNLEN